VNANERLKAIRAKLEEAGVKVLPHDEYVAGLPETTCVCGPDTYFSDDVKAKCDICGGRIYHRPYNQAAKKKICTACFIKNPAQFEDPQ